MKKKIYALMLVVAMLAMTLVACGSDTNDTTNTTNDVTVNTEVEESGDDVVVEPTEEPTVTPEVEEPVVEPTPEEVVDGENDTPMYAYSTTFVFPDDMEGFTRKYLNEDYPDWSVNETHYIDTNGNEMNFEWEGSAALGESAGVNSNTLNLKEKSNTYEIRAWHGGSMNMEDIEPALAADSTVWTNTTSSFCSLPENGYYNVERVENTLIVTYELIDNNSGQIGYARFLANADIGETYCFMYLETPETFDDTRAMNVINSFDFWEYIPEETTTE